MISIKQYMEQRRHSVRPLTDVLDASLETVRLLLDAMASQTVRGREADHRVFSRTMKALSQRMKEPPTALNLLSVASEASEAMEIFAHQTSEYVREENQQMQAMVSMLAETLADISGQADARVGQLHAIEQQLERATGLDDMRVVSASLASCLAAVREAAAQHRRGSQATMERLRSQIRAAESRIEPASKRVSQREIDLAPEAAEEVPTARASSSYVAAFRLQRAEHIASRFGDGVRHQMLALIGQNLKTVLGANDRLLRWKGTSFVLFLNSTATLNEIRVLLSETVARTGQHYIEVGQKTALLSVGVDWIVFPQAQCPSLEAVFTEVDSFLAGEPGEAALPAVP
jgi:GGDEF domain-containing protein